MEAAAVVMPTRLVIASATSGSVLPVSELPNWRKTLEPNAVVLPDSAREESRPCTGVWSEWGDMSDCDCSLGTGYRTRECCGAELGACAGRDAETRDCGRTCFGEWETWQPCSVSCGTGLRSRTLPCLPGSVSHLLPLCSIKPSSTSDAMNCERREEVEPCEAPLCAPAIPTLTPLPSTSTPSPAFWTSWTEFSPCSGPHSPKPQLCLNQLYGWLMF